MTYEQWRIARSYTPDRRQEEAFSAATAAMREPQPCGHPRAAVVVDAERRDGEYEQHCGWCASLDAERREEQARCVTVAHMTPIEKPSETEIEELHFTAGPLDAEGEAWAYYHGDMIAQAIDYTCKEAQEYRAAIREAEDKTNDVLCYVCGGTGDGIGYTDCPVCFGTGREADNAGT